MVLDILRPSSKGDMGRSWAARPAKLHPGPQPKPDTHPVTPTHTHTHRNAEALPWIRNCTRFSQLFFCAGPRVPELFEGDEELPRFGISRCSRFQLQVAPAPGESPGVVSHLLRAAIEQPKLHQRNDLQIKDAI